MSSRFRILAAAAALLLGFALIRPAGAQDTSLRLSVNNWKVDPGDNYTLDWMPGPGVNPVDGYLLEESGSADFKKDKDYVAYSERGTRKQLENPASLSHAVRYYRVRCTAWVRDEMSGDSSRQDIVSNVVRVILVGTNKAIPVPSFPDDPEPRMRHKKKKGEDSHKSEEEYPAMGLPDLVVAKIVTDPPHPVVGQPFRVLLRVVNQGVVPSPATHVKVEGGGRTFILEVPALKPNYKIVVADPEAVTMTAAGKMHVKATVDPDNDVQESREDNNVTEADIDVPSAPKVGAGTGSPSK